MLSLNFRDAQPIYEQVKSQLRKLIISGGFAPGERLPSVRDLSAQMAINPNTIQRSYRELEAEGYIYSIPGKGSFAAQVEQVDEKRKEALLRTFDTTVSELKYLKISEQELIARIKGGCSHD